MMRPPARSVGAALPLSQLAARLAASLLRRAPTPPVPTRLRELSRLSNLAALQGTSLSSLFNAKYPIVLHNDETRSL